MNMTENTAIAAELYRTAIGLKQYTASKLFWKTNRNKLRDALHTMRRLVSEIEVTDAYSDEYRALLSQMDHLLDSCLACLENREKGYRTKVYRYILAFHNMPRAFLSIGDRAKITPKEAVEYSMSYLNNTE